jgi:Holliday junction resolvase RusA-like endonuclease
MPWIPFVEFELTGPPVPYARTGGGKTVVRFTPPRQRKYMDDLVLVARMAMRGKQPLTGPVRMDFIAKFPFPKKMSGVNRLATHWHTARPDKSNVEKIIEDALKGFVWLDDSQVSSGYSEKIYADEPLVHVKVFSWAD